MIRQTDNDAFAQDLCDRVFDLLARIFADDMKDLSQFKPFGLFKLPARQGLRDLVNKCHATLRVCSDNCVAYAAQGRDQLVSAPLREALCSPDPFNNQSDQQRDGEER